MNCYVHPEKEAVGTCVGCGKFICSECLTEVQNKNYCKSCIGSIIQENQKKLEKLEESGKQQPMVFMNAGGGGGGSSSSSSAASSAGAGAGGRLVPVKSKTAAGLLAIFLGGLGVHKFYLGKPLMGILYLLFCWTGVPAVVGLIEGIIYLCKTDEEFAAKYGGRLI